MLRKKWAGLLILLFGFPILGGAQCGEWLSEKTVNIPLSFSIEVPLDIDKAVKDAGMTADVNGKLPAGTPTKTVEVPYQQPVDISSRDEIKTVKAKLKYVKIEALTISVLSNSMNIDLPPVEISMSLKAANNFSKMATYPGIKAGQTENDRAIQNDANQDAISQMLLSFAFDIKALARLTIQAGTPVPKGALQVKIFFKIVFSVAPFGK